MTGMRRRLLASAFLLMATQLWAADQHSVQGILLKVNPASQSIVVSCDAIPGYMDAMVMPFIVRGQANLKSLVPGATVRFDMVESKNQSIAEHLRVVEVTNHESEPTGSAGD